jgi:hypothetical protein
VFLCLATKAVVQLYQNDQLLSYSSSVPYASQLFEIELFVPQRAGPVDYCVRLLDLEAPLAQKSACVSVMVVEAVWDAARARLSVVPDALPSYAGHGRSNAALAIECAEQESKPDSVAVPTPTRRCVIDDDARAQEHVLVDARAPASADSDGRAVEATGLNVSAWHLPKLWAAFDVAPQSGSEPSSSAAVAERWVVFGAPPTLDGSAHLPLAVRAWRQTGFKTRVLLVGWDRGVVSASLRHIEAELRAVADAVEAVDADGRLALVAALIATAAPSQLVREADFVAPILDPLALPLNPPLWHGNAQRWAREMVVFDASRSDCFGCLPTDAGCSAVVDAPSPDVPTFARTRAWRGMFGYEHWPLESETVGAAVDAIMRREGEVRHALLSSTRLQAVWIRSFVAASLGDWEGYPSQAHFVARARWADEWTAAHAALSAEHELGSHLVWAARIEPFSLGCGAFGSAGAWRAALPDGAEQARVEQYADRLARLAARSAEPQPPRDYLDAPTWEAMLDAYATMHEEIVSGESPNQRCVPAAPARCAALCARVCVCVCVCWRVLARS